MDIEETKKNLLVLAKDVAERIETMHVPQAADYKAVKMYKNKLARMSDLLLKLWRQAQ